VSSAPHFRWTSAARSHVGLIRAINEDAHLNHPERGLWAVADGMGGHSVGDFASRMVINKLNEIQPHSSLANFLVDAHERLQFVNQRLRAEAATRNVQRIGSTVAVLLAWNGHCACLWAGDSRIYLYRNGTLSLLTRDHTQIEQLKARGELTSEEAVGHPARNVITRAVGAVDRLKLDELIVEVDDGDVFLLCSDGLSNEVSDQDIRRVLASGDCLQASEALVALALERGGRDNISAVVVRSEDPCGEDKTLFNPDL
jgi:protein phosphatase